MLLPIVAYGDPVLRKVTEDIEPGYNGLQELIDNMFETMYNSSGVGLAAPQVGLSIRLFIMDTAQLREDSKSKVQDGIRKVFINATMISEKGEDWSYEEGCLSIPGIREDVLRKPKIRIEYYDEKFRLHEEEFEGVNARVIQHEYDHVEGILFIDHLNPLKKRFLKKKLSLISRGEIDVDYKMSFPL